LRLAATSPAARRLSACSLAFAALQLSLATYLVTYLAHDSAITLVQAGLMLAIAQGAGIVARIAWGALADRGGRPLLVLGGVGCAMGAERGGPRPSLRRHAALVVMLVCATFGRRRSAGTASSSPRSFATAPPGKASDATGGALFYTYLGILIGPSIFAVIAGGGLGYSAAYVLIAIPALACGVWLTLLKRPSLEASGASGRSRKGHHDGATPLPFTGVLP
jgi:MFS family permease